MNTVIAIDALDDLMSAYLRHLNFFRSALRKRTGSHDLAEDAMQETWFRLAGMKADALDIRDHNAFILRVAGNIATDLARREMRHSSRCISDDQALEAMADSYPSPEAFVIDRDRLRQLVAALSKLPEKPRAALLMNRCDGLKHSEIARRLAVSESMVARYLAQALRHCRDHCRDSV